MKKLLSVLAAVGLTTTAAVSVVACTKKVDSTINAQATGVRELQKKISVLKSQANSVDNKTSDLSAIAFELDQLKPIINKQLDQNNSKNLTEQLEYLKIEVENLRLELTKKIDQEVFDEKIRGLQEQLDILKESNNQKTDQIHVLEKNLNEIQSVGHAAPGWNTAEVPRNSKNTNWEFARLKNFLNNETNMWMFNFLATSQNGTESRHRIYTGTTLISKDIFRDKREVMFNIGFTAFNDGALINDYIRGWFIKDCSDLLVSMHPYDNNDRSWKFSTLKIAWSAVN